MFYKWFASNLLPNTWIYYRFSQVAYQFIELSPQHSQASWSITIHNWLGDPTSSHTGPKLEVATVIRTLCWLYGLLFFFGQPPGKSRKKGANPLICWTKCHLAQVLTKCVVHLHMLGRGFCARRRSRSRNHSNESNCHFELFEKFINWKSGFSYEISACDCRRLRGKESGQLWNSNVVQWQEQLHLRLHSHLCLPVRSLQPARRVARMNTSPEGPLMGDVAAGNSSSSSCCKQHKSH